MRLQNVLRGSCSEMLITWRRVERVVLDSANQLRWWIVVKTWPCIFFRIFKSGRIPSGCHVFCRAKQNFTLYLTFSAYLFIRKRRQNRLENSKTARVQIVISLDSFPRCNRKFLRNTGENPHRTHRKSIFMRITVENIFATRGANHKHFPLKFSAVLNLIRVEWSNLLI